MARRPCWARKSSRGRCGFSMRSCSRRLGREGGRRCSRQLSTSCCDLSYPSPPSRWWWYSLTRGMTPPSRSPLSEGRWLALALLLDCAEKRRLGQREEDNLFPGGRADVVVQAQHLDSGNLMDHGLHERSRRFDQLSSDLLEEIPPLFRRKGLHQLLFGRRQHA